MKASSKNSNTCCTSKEAFHVWMSHPHNSLILSRKVLDDLPEFMWFTAGGSSKALLIVNISPSNADIQETLSSLNFASRARNVELSLGNRDTIKKWRDMVCPALIFPFQSVPLQNGCFLGTREPAFVANTAKLTAMYSSSPSMMQCLLVPELLSARVWACEFQIYDYSVWWHVDPYIIGLAVDVTEFFYLLGNQGSINLIL